MKIGVYVQTWHVGGVAAFCERLALGLQRLGHAPCLLLATPFGKRDPAGRSSYHRLLELDRFPVKCLHLSAFHPSERAWRAADVISALACDALLLSSHGPLAGAWARLCGTTPLIGIAHNDDEDTFAEFRACEAYCDGYAAVSRTIFQTLEALAPRGSPAELRHVPYGVPITPAPSPAPESRQGRVLAVGRLEQRQKLVLDLPLIWEEYRRRGGLATLTICGSGPEEPALRQAFVRELDNGGVCLRGAVALDQMPALYAQHEVLLSVSAYEGLPISVLEATTQGLFPLLSKIRSGHQEIVDAVGAGRVCAVGDIAGFASALVDITSVTGRAELRQTRPHIRTRACSLYGLERMVKEYADLAARICQGRAARRAGRDDKTDLGPRPRVDFVRAFIRKWQYSRHYGWQH